MNQLITVVNAGAAGAAEAIQAIRRASKSGLRELRTILEVLRQVDGGSPAVPVPDLRAIAALVEATSAAGTPTTLELVELPVPLPPPVTLAVYRIVQESLTNVVRHAGRVAATVGLRHDGGYLYVDVVNDGGAAPAAFNDGTFYPTGGRVGRLRDHVPHHPQPQRQPRRARRHSSGLTAAEPTEASLSRVG